MSYLKGPVRQPADNVADDDKRNDVDDVAAGRVARRRKYYRTTWPDMTASDAKPTDKQNVEADDDGERTRKADDSRVSEVGARRDETVRVGPPHRAAVADVSRHPVRLRHVIGEQQDRKHESERSQPDDCHREHGQFQRAIP